MKYRICWRSKLTGTTRKGPYVEQLLAEAWFAEWQTKFPTLHNDNWLEDEAGSILTDPPGPVGPGQGGELP